MKSDAFPQQAAGQGAEARFMGPEALGDYTRAKLAC